MRFKPFSRSRPRRRGSRRRAPTYRFTIVSVSATLNALRKHCTSCRRWTCAC